MSERMSCCHLQRVTVVVRTCLGNQVSLAMARLCARACVHVHKHMLVLRRAI